MLWTPDLARYLEEAPWLATKEELLDYANRTAVPLQVIENLQELTDDEEAIYDNIEDIWPEAFNHDDMYMDEDVDDY